MIRGCSYVIAFAILSTSAPISAARKPDVSWGKAEVSYEQYRNDSVDCGLAGATRDMSGQTAYKQALHGIQTQNSVLDQGAGFGGPDTLLQYVLIQRRTMQRQVPELQRYLVSGVERCLIGKGYTPFLLTRSQKRELSKLPRGTEGRFRYLHALATDGSVLAAQGVAIEKATAEKKGN